jgi:TBC1 domain family member 5
MEGETSCIQTLAPVYFIPLKLFLVPHEPLDTDIKPSSLLTFLQQSRQKYTDLMLEKMKAPDGSYERSFIIPGTEARSPTRDSPDQKNLEKNNPLSLDSEVFI